MFRRQENDNRELGRARVPFESGPSRNRAAANRPRPAQGAFRRPVGGHPRAYTLWMHALNVGVSDRKLSRFVAVSDPIGARVAFFDTV